METVKHCCLNCGSNLFVVYGNDHFKTNKAYLCTNCDSRWEVSKYFALLMGKTKEYHAPAAAEPTVKKKKKDKFTGLCRACSVKRVYIKGICKGCYSTMRYRFGNDKIDAIIEYRKSNPSREQAKFMNIDNRKVYRKRW